MCFRIEQIYQNVMALWHQLHLNMKSVVAWNYLVKDIETIHSWNKDTVRIHYFFLNISVRPYQKSINL